MGSQQTSGGARASSQAGKAWAWIKKLPPKVRFGFAVILVGGLAILGVYLVGRGRHWAWGDVPTWITGAGTVGAVIVALYQVAKERQRRIAREEQDRQERRLAQARLVAAWVGGPARRIQMIRVTRVGAGLRFNW